MVTAVEDEDELVLVELVVHHHDLPHPVDVLLEHAVQLVEQRGPEPIKLNLARNDELEDISINHLQ